MSEPENKSDDGPESVQVSIRIERPPTPDSTPEAAPEPQESEPVVQAPPDSVFKKRPVVAAQSPRRSTLTESFKNPDLPAIKKVDEDDEDEDDDLEEEVIIHEGSWIQVGGRWKVSWPKFQDLDGSWEECITTIPPLPEGLTGKVVRCPDARVVILLPDDRAAELDQVEAEFLNDYRTW